MATRIHNQDVAPDIDVSKIVGLADVATSGDAGDITPAGGAFFIQVANAAGTAITAVTGCTIDASGNLSATHFYGDGTNITGVAVPTGSAGWVQYTDGSGNLAANAGFTSDGSGNVTATSFNGDGSGLTAVAQGTNHQIQYNASGELAGDTATTDGAGNISATSFSGDGSGLTAVAKGTDTQLQYNAGGELAGDTATTDGAGNIVATSFAGDGSALTAVAKGVNTNVQYNASGELAGDASFTTDGAGNVTVTTITGDGSLLTNLASAQITDFPTFVDGEALTGTPNGVLTTFDVSVAPNPATSIHVYKNGLRMQLTADYTFTGTTVTFVTAPDTGSVLIADYRY